jgi:hypothetical protein
MTSKSPAPPRKLSTLADRLGKLSEAIEARRKAQAAADAAQEVEDGLRAAVLQAMLDAEIESTRGAGMTVSVRRSTVPQVQDWAALDAYIVKHKALDLLQRRVSATAWRERVDAGQEVPGVTAFTRVDLSTRAA